MQLLPRHCRPIESQSCSISHGVQLLLIATSGNFSLYIRDYWADESLINGKWIPPVVIETAEEPALRKEKLMIQANRYDALANSETAENRHTPETANQLREELLFQRGTQT